jgi:hypothetical protein
VRARNALTRAVASWSLAAWHSFVSFRLVVVTIAGFLEVPVFDHRWPETEQMTAEGSALRFPLPGKVARW